MNGLSKAIYRFGEYRLIPAERMLLKNDDVVQLPPKAFDILVVLVENAGELVDNKHMLEMVWPDSFVEEANIHVQISSLRKALGQNGDRNHIETIPKVGYRFTSKVSRINGSQASPETAKSEIGKMQEPKADGAVAAAAPSRRKSVAAVICILVFAVIGIGAIGFRQILRRPVLFEKVSISKITNTGKELMSAISPDGTNLVYQHSEDGKTGLWLRNIPSGAEKRLLDPSESDLESLVFSPSGDSVYFAKSERNEPVSVYKLSIRDGTPIRLIDRINSRVTFSPDGGRIAFTRVDPVNSTWDIITANRSGGDERTITRSTPGELIRYPAWSPASNKLAAFKMNREADDSGNRYSLIEIDADNGEIALISQERWQSFGDIVWLKDGTGLVFTASKQIGTPAQIWYLDRATGTSKQLTNDTSNYSGVTIDDRSNTISAIKNERQSGIWITVDNKDPGHLAKASSGAATQEGDWGVAFGPGNRILYTAQTEGNWDVWTMNFDGSDRVRLTTNDFYDIEPVAVPNTGKMIYASQVRKGMTHIWSMNVDGSEKVQLTNRLYESYPVVTPDGKWLVFMGADNLNEDRIWKMPVAGGDAMQISDKSVRSKLAISPDSRLLAFASSDDLDSGKMKLFLIPLMDEGPIKSLDIPSGFVPNTDLRWSPDGSSITYKAAFGPNWNLWDLPVYGGSPKQLTHFENEQIYAFNWSNDGKLVLTKGQVLSDVVLIRQQN